MTINSAQEIPSEAFPDLILQLSEYIITDNTFKHYSDPHDKIDLLYEKSLSLTKNNVSDALLLLTLSTVPYSSVPINIPYLKISFNIPLPAEDANLKKRMDILPGDLYFYSKNNSADIDKLCHFFGSAFLSYKLPHYNLSDFIGILIELFEGSFVSRGENDPRDLMSNGLGSLFGVSLNVSHNIKPSCLFKHYSLLYFRYY